MKKIHLLCLLFLASTLFFVSCSEDQDEILSSDTVSTKLEPEFFENDGSQGLDGEERAEEEAPGQGLELATKTYYRNYTLLKPEEMMGDIDELKCGESTTMPLLVGSRKKEVGKVVVSNDDNYLYLTVGVNDYKYMKKVYFYIGDKADIPYYSNGFPKLYAFNYKAFPYYYGGQKKATYKIPLSSIDTDCFEIIAYAKIFDKRSWCYYSAFAYSPEKTQRYYYSYQTGCYYFRDWVRSFEYCKQDCEDNCLEIYGKKHRNDLTECLNPGTSQSEGSYWTNWLSYILMFDGNRHDLDLFANDTNCDATGLTQIAQIQIINDENSDTKLNVKYLVFDDAYKMSSLSLYMGTEKNPYDENGNLKPGVSASDFYTKDFDTPVSEYEFSVEWDGSQDPSLLNYIYYIGSIKVCQ